MTRGRPVLGGFGGLLFGISLALCLLVFGVVRLDSPLLLILPLAFLALGILWAFWAPIGGGSDETPPPVAAPPPQQQF